MKKINTKIIKVKMLKRFLFFVLVGAMVVSTQQVVAWDGPTANPPYENVATPINVGITEQTKQGTLGSSEFCLLGNCITAWPEGSGGSSLWTQNGSKIYYNTGNVGIGAADPGEKLEVAGNVEVNKMEDRDQPGYYTDPGGNSMLQNIYASKLYDKDNTSYYIDPANTSVFNTINLGGVSRTTWPEGGSGGVSKITAGSNITISPISGIGDVTINSSGGSGSSLWTESGSDIYYNGGKVGIGTASPSSGARVTITSGGSGTAALYWGISSSPTLGFLGVRDNNTALIGAAHSANNLIFRAGDRDRLTIKNDNSIRWHDAGGTQIGFLGYSGSSALVGAPSSSGGNLILKAGGQEVMTIKSDGQVCIGTDCRAGWPGGEGGYTQSGLYGSCVRTTSSYCSGHSPAYCSSGMCYCNSGFSRVLTGKANSESESYYTCRKN